MATAKGKIQIVIDTREQTPLSHWPEWVQPVRGTLKTGDYSIAGYEEAFAVERKSLADFAGTMIGAYEARWDRPPLRFNRELERLRHLDCSAVVVTATPEEVRGFRHHCGMDAHGALWGFALSIFVGYRLPVFCYAEPLASIFVADLARHFITSRGRRYRVRGD